MKKTYFIIVIIFGLFLSSAWAETSKFEYKGRITLNGNPQTSIIQNATFLIFKQASGGAALWSETKSITPDQTGRFSTILGDTAAIPDSIDFSVPYWLEIIIGGDSLGRQPLLAVPYALKASTAEIGLGAFIIPSVLKVGLNLQQQPNASIATAGSIQIDQEDTNNGGEGTSWNNVGPGVQFGADNSGEGIRSKRTAGGNQYGLDFVTNYLTRMSVKNNGNVGIGTTNPSLSLTVAGDCIRMRSENSASILDIETPQSGNASIKSLKNNLFLSAVNSRGSLNNIIINSANGNVGAGTTNPKYKLDVAGAGRFGTGGSAANNGAGLLIMYGILGADNKNRGVLQGYDQSVSTNTRKDIVINRYAGNVGIGSDIAPQVKLDVAGQGRFTGRQLYSGSGGAGVEIQFSEDKGYVFACDRGNSTSTGKSLTLNHLGGKVGIRNNDPAANLDVNGTIRFRNFNNTDGNVSIYFDSDGYLIPFGSDKRLKKDIFNISDRIDVIEALNKLRGVYYRWDTNNDKVKNYGNRKNIGLIAQEVEKVIPQVVSTGKDGYKSVNYSQLNAFLVEVNNVKQKEIEDMEKRLEKLEKRINK